jgi:hypothetical protein
MPVALCGPERLPDREFSAAIFAVARTVAPFRRGSRSRNRSEAAADAAQAAHQTPPLIHGFANELFAPSGPTAPPVRSTRRGRN